MLSRVKEKWILFAIDDWRTHKALFEDINCDLKAVRDRKKKVHIDNNMNKKNVIIISTSTTCSSELRESQRGKPHEIL